MRLHHRTTRTGTMPGAALHNPYSTLVAGAPRRSHRLDLGVRARRYRGGAKPTHLSVPRCRRPLVAQRGVQNDHDSGRLRHVTTDADRDQGPGLPYSRSGSRFTPLLRRSATPKEPLPPREELAPVLAIQIGLRGRSARGVSGRFAASAHAQLREEIRHVVLHGLLGEEHLF